MSGADRKMQKIMTSPIHLTYRFLQNKSRVQVWLDGIDDLRIEGVIIGFDEFMNLTLDDAEEIHMSRRTRKSVGRIMLKGDTVSLVLNTGK